MHDGHADLCVDEGNRHPVVVQQFVTSIAKFVQRLQNNYKRNQHDSEQDPYNIPDAATAAI